MLMNTPTLTSDRLILRKFTDTDILALFEIFRDPEVNTFLPWFPLENLAEAEQFYQERYEKPYEETVGYRYAICLKTDNLPIGYINVNTTSPYDFGYGLRKEFWHQGIVSEAGQLVIEQLEKDGVPYITATHDQKNPRSGNVMRRLGMQYAYSYEELWQPKNIPVVFRMYQLNLANKAQPISKDHWEMSGRGFVEEGL